ncbi:FAD/NAD(P)-binding domain-containing protein [Suillus weaverae]|nr:FAD/NAD(P)-binding domain-containing protein [Suillus weaverae]
MSHPILSESEFDIVFAGGGTTACVVAGRLAAYDPSLRILILEAGQHTLNKPIHVQPSQCRFNQAPTSTTVTFNIGNPSPHLNGRAPIVSCGRCVGGGSCVNSMVYTRAPASDYDDWGVNGWESENLIPLMKKLETYEVQPDRPTHGYDGPIKVSSGECKMGIAYEFIQVGTTYHKRQYVDDTDDLETCNTYSSIAIFWLMYKRYIDGTTGMRSDAAHHYVYNQAHNPNLQVWDGKRVKRELKAMDPVFQPRWKEFFQDRPDKAVAIFAPFARYVPPLSRPLSSILHPRSYMSASYFTLYPLSVGSVHINITENGKEGMDFTTGFLDDPSDIVPLDFGYKKTREIFRRMASYRGEVAAGHPDFPEGSAAACREASGPVDLDAPDIVYTAEDDEAINKFHRDIVQTAWHSVCAAELS